MENRNLRSFGRFKISEKSQTSKYESKPWAELSLESSVMMYETFPGTSKPVDMPSLSIDLSKMVSMFKKDKKQSLRTSRREKIKNEKMKIKSNANHMAQLYRENPELTDFTTSLENEDFYEY